MTEKERVAREDSRRGHGPFPCQQQAPVRSDSNGKLMNPSGLFRKAERLLLSGMEEDSGELGSFRQPEARDISRPL